MSKPIPPTAEHLGKIAQWQIDTTSGKIYGLDGSEIGWINNKNGYCYVTAYGTYKPRHFRRANVIWWKAKGKWPDMELDHRDRNKTNDTLGNLQEATRSEQQLNRALWGKWDWSWERKPKRPTEKT